MRAIPRGNKHGIPPHSQIIYQPGFQVLHRPQEIEHELLSQQLMPPHYPAGVLPSSGLTQEEQDAFTYSSVPHSQF